MKNIIALTAVIAVLSCSNVQAASVRADELGNNIWGIYLLGEADNGNFDTVIVDITGAFANPDPSGVDGTTPRQAGDEFTYINPFLSAPVAFGGKGYSVLGPMVSTSQVAFTAGPLGLTIDTGSEGVFLANILLESGAGLASVQLVTAGSVIQTTEAIFGVPEPTTLALTGLSMIGLVATRRRRS